MNRDEAVTEFHHGDCVGADELAHKLAKEVLLITTIVHPPKDLRLRAWCEGDAIMPPKPYLERNRDIVDSCDLLIAVPATWTSVPHSGTWATIRYAISRGKSVLMLFPDGSKSVTDVHYEEGGR